MKDIDEILAEARSIAAQPIRTRAAYRVAVAVSKRTEKMTFVELESLIDREIDRDDGLESMGDAYCPNCEWIGRLDDCLTPLLRRGGPFSGPLDGATPPEYGDGECPKCGQEVEEC